MTHRPEPWQTPELTAINRLPMASPLLPASSPERALERNRDANEWFLLLNGTWRFARFDTPALAEQARVALASGTASEFRPIDVPGNWTLQDTVDKPIYTNVQMPFDNTPPLVPEQNPTALYSKRFELPGAFAGRRLLLHFGGVESYYEVYLNGVFVGMAKDSRLPSEFDITEFVDPSADNELIVKVLRFCDSSYIEDQDQWWMAGIFRDVYLYTTGPEFLRDVSARADYDPAGRDGSLDLSVTVGFAPKLMHADGGLGGPRNAYSVHARLVGPSGATVWVGSARIDPSYRVTEYQAELSAMLPGIAPWSSESPTLYSLVVSLHHEDGTHIESRCVRTGFRRVEIRDRELLINGRPVLIKGVNRHEHDDRLGKVMTRELMLKDILTLKRFNFNAVRTSHYPDTIEWYDLCDEYGIYLIDEANIEAHANYPLICRDPRWALAFEERMTRMVLRDRNHPSVIGWSAGNESGHGENHVRAIDRVREIDPTRFIHHEGEVKTHWTQGGNAYTGGSNRYNDLVNPMYPSIESIIKHSVDSTDRRPVILCEYSHAMGNSNGSLCDYFDAFERYPGLQGGFIWEWVDHGIVQTDPAGREYWAYGGDFGETIHDSNFVADGLVWPDRAPHPAMWEFKKLAQPLAVDAIAVREGRFAVRNKQDFLSLGWLDGSWRVEVEGGIVHSAELPPLDAPAGGAMEVVLDYPESLDLDAPEAHVLFEFRARTATPWCEAGHLVAWEQIAPNGRWLPAATSAASADGLQSPLTMTDAVQIPAATPIATAPRPAIRFAGEPIVVAAPRLNLFRAATDNDGIREWTGQKDKPMVQWIDAGLHDLRVRSHEYTGGGSSPVVERFALVGSDPDAVIVHEQRVETVAPDLMRFDVTVDAPGSLPSLPRIGVLLKVAAGFESLRWFGRGPQENHIDRWRGYPVGLYSGTVAEQFVPYIMPQENGSKCEVRWFELSNGSVTARFIADPLFEFSVHHVTPEDLFACRHTPDVEDRLRPETIVSIDLRQRGVGTGSCGPQTLEQYLVDPGTYRFGFYLQVRPVD